MLAPVKGLKLFLNPKLPDADYQIFLRLAQRLMMHDHVLLASSGTSGQLKLIALSQAALKVAAESVNQHIQASSKDVWVLALPMHHIGGFSLTVRAQLSGSKLAEFKDKWSAQKFVEFCIQEKATLTSLVPTQIWDLVQAQLRAPQTLRAVFVGGAALDPILYEKARALGWPLLPCYGMTETCAQVACASLDSLQKNTFPELEILPHVQVQVRDEGKLAFASPALLSCLATDDNGWVSVIDPKQHSWFESEDFGEVSGNTLKIFGRGEDFVKIAGEAVLLSQIQSMLERLAPEFVGKIAVLALDHERHGSQLVLVSEERIPQAKLEVLLEELDSKVLPVARLQAVYFAEKLPRTSLGKIKCAELRAMILSQSRAQLLWQR